MYLTREQAAAGELCRGCGLPVIDNLGNWPGTMYLTDKQRGHLRRRPGALPRDASGLLHG